MAERYSALRRWRPCHARHFPASDLPSVPFTPCRGAARVGHRDQGTFARLDAPRPGLCRELISDESEVARNARNQPRCRSFRIGVAASGEICRVVIGGQIFRSDRLATFGTLGSPSSDCVKRPCGHDMPLANPAGAEVDVGYFLPSVSRRKSYGQHHFGQVGSREEPRQTNARRGFLGGRDLVETGLCPRNGTRRDHTGPFLVPRPDQNGLSG